MTIFSFLDPTPGIYNASNGQARAGNQRFITFITPFARREIDGQPGLSGFIPLVFPNQKYNLKYAGRTVCIGKVS